MTIRKLIRNSYFTIGDKIIAVLVQFISIPVLLSVYGKDNYGLIALAASLNIFLAILNFGLPMGFPKFVAEWLAGKNSSDLYPVSGTVFSLYISIGVVSLAFLLIIAFLFISVFNVTPEQMPVLRDLLVVTAVTALVAMPANFLDQILVGAQDLWFVSLTQIAKNAIYILLIAYIYVSPDSISLLWFYILQNLITFSMVAFKIRRWRHFGSYRIFMPQWQLKSTVPVLKYCMALMTFSIFTLLDNASKPLIIGIYGENASEQMADFQIISIFRVFFMLLATSLMQALVPYLTQQSVIGGEAIYEKMITQGTKIIWAIGALVGGLTILLSEQIVILYVGSELLYLAPLICLYVIATMYNIYVTGIAAAVLSSGKLAPMVWATCAGFIVSIVISLAFFQSLQLKAIIYSLVGYNIIHFLVLHFYYLKTQFLIDPISHLSRVALPPVLAVILMYFIAGEFMKVLNLDNIYAELLVESTLGSAIYITVIAIIYIRPREVRDRFRQLLLIKKLRN